MLGRAEINLLIRLLNALILTVTAAYLLKIFRDTALVNHDPVIAEYQRWSGLQGPKTPPSLCRVVRPPIKQHFYDHWQNVTIGGDLQIFSAYIDDDGVRAIGAATLFWKKKPIYCHVRHLATDGDGAPVMRPGRLQIVPGTIEHIPQGHWRQFSCFFFVCPGTLEGVPYAVSIVTEDETQTKPNAIRIAGQYPRNYKFAVCVKPFHDEYDNVHQIVEFIELNRLLGAEYFVFYIYSIGSNVRKILNLYRKEGLIELVFWDLKIPEDLITDWAGHAARNDCLYRLRGVTEYMVHVDVDEFIIPRDTTNWEDMMAQLPANGAYTFRNSFFDTIWPSTNESYAGVDIVNKYNLTSMLKVQREAFIYPPHERSKLIVKPCGVRIMGTHSAHTMWYDSGRYVVDPSIAISHHYRTWENNPEKVTDTTAIRYKEPLIRNIQQRWDMITDNISLE